VPPDLAVFKGPTSKEREEGRGRREEMERGGERMEGEGKGKQSSPPLQCYLDHFDQMFTIDSMD